MSSDLLDIVGDIYEASYKPEHWKIALKQVCTCFSARSGGLFIQDKQIRANSALHTHNFPKFASIAYNLGLGALDPGFKVMASLPIGKTEVIIGENVDISPVYQKLMLDPVQIHHAVGLNIFNDDEWHVGLGLHRSNTQGAFSEDEMKIISSLMPHFQRSLRIQKEITRLTRQRNAIEASLYNVSLGVIIINDQQVVTYANPVAQAFIDSGSPIQLTAKGKLALTDEGGNEQLRSALTTLLAGNKKSHSLSLTHKDRKQPIALLLQTYNTKDVLAGLETPHDTGVIAYITDLNAETVVSAETLNETFDLTPAEARLVIGLTNGLSLEAFADQNHVSLYTVRSQLKTTFSKMGISRQQDLIRLVLKLNI